EVATANGYAGTEADWLASLKGADGANGTNGVDGANGTNGVDGTNGTNGVDGANGTNGVDGKSAYEVAKANGYAGTEADWLASLKGADGTNGTNGTNGVDGKSAYEVAKANGYVGTEAEWLASLKGADGTNGVDGANGTNGTNGTNGKDAYAKTAEFDGVNMTAGNATTVVYSAVDGHFVVDFAPASFGPPCVAVASVGFDATTGSTARARVVDSDTVHVAVLDSAGTKVNHPFSLVVGC
ncbi:MAG: hypothetical protein M3Q27_09000, partial [Actinomycetota bacterium]|nr:hypothetical protein [Actinomycetota bacterium]